MSTLKTVDQTAMLGSQRPPSETQPETSDQSWTRVVGSFVEQFNADAGGIVVQHLNKSQGRVLYATNLPADFLWGCDERATLDRFWLRAVRQLAAPGDVRQVRLPTQGAATGSLFKHWLHPHELRRILFAALAHKSETVVFLVLMRREDRDRFTSRELREVRILTPVLASAWALDRTARARAGAMNAAWGALDVLSLGVVVVNREGVVYDMNNRARDLIARGGGLTVRQGRLCCRGHRDDQSLRNVLGALLDSAPNLGPDSERALSISCSGDHAPLRVMLAPLRCDGWRQGHNESMVAVFLADPEGSASPKERWLRDLYGLTRMEAEVAVLLCHGHQPKEIAERLRISVHTVRGYMTQIFSKAGVSSQTELLRQFMIFTGRFNANRGTDAA